MKDSELLLAFFNDMVGPGKRFPSRVEMARFLGLPQTQATKLFNFLKGSDTQYRAVLDWLEKLGGSVNIPGERAAEAGQDVCFVNARVVPMGENQAPPKSEDYMAVPLVEEVGAGPGVIPQGEMLSWFLVYKHQDAVRYRRNLIAVQIGKTSTSMEPTLHPGDAVLIDRDDRDVKRPGRMMLVLDPDGAGKIKRVSVEPRKNGDYRILYYSDNAADNPPEVYSLRDDFLNDWDRAIVGRVVWAWSDVSNK